MCWKISGMCKAPDYNSTYFEFKYSNIPKVLKHDKISVFSCIQFFKDIAYQITDIETSSLKPGPNLARNRHKRFAQHLHTEGDNNPGLYVK